MRTPLSLLGLVIFAVSASAGKRAGVSRPLYWAPKTVTTNLMFDAPDGKDHIPAPPNNFEVGFNSPLCLIAPAADIALDSRTPEDAKAYLRLVRHAIASPTMTKRTPRYEIRCGFASDPDMNQARVTGNVLNAAFDQHCHTDGAQRYVLTAKRFTSTMLVADGRAVTGKFKRPFAVIIDSFRDLVKPDRDDATVIETLKVMRLIELYDAVAQAKTPVNAEPFPTPIAEIKALPVGFAQLAAMVLFDGSRSSAVRVEALKTLATLAPNLAGARLMYRRFELSDDEAIRAAAIEGFTLAVLDMWAYDQSRRDLVTVNVPDPTDDQRVTPRRPLCRIGSLTESFRQLTKKEDPKNQVKDERTLMAKAANCVYPALRGLTPPNKGPLTQDEHIKQFCSTSAD